MIVQGKVRRINSHKSSTIDHIPVELIKAGGKTFCSEIYQLIISIWNKEGLPEWWKESINVPIYMKGDKTDCSNYRDISLLPTTYKILSNILQCRLIPYVEEIIGDHQCGFRRNRSTADHIQGVSRLQGITAGGDFLGLCDEKSSYKHVSDFGQLRSYHRLKLRIEGNDY